jgi:hypothetical protein
MPLLEAVTFRRRRCAGPQFPASKSPRHAGRADGCVPGVEIDSTPVGVPSDDLNL